jgi:hypothetical protein
MMDLVFETIGDTSFFFSVGGGGAPATARRRAGRHDVIDCIVRALSRNRVKSHVVVPIDA